jgi:cytoskeletal protein CcmA (bactofilin family)
MALFGGRSTKHAPPGYSVIDDRLAVRGELDTDGTVRVDGRVEGTMHRAGTLIVGGQGTVIGDVNAGDVVVAGTLHGNVQATGRVEIEATATVFGAIQAASMSLVEGGVVHGQVAIGALPATAATATSGAPPRLEVSSTPPAALPAGRSRG